MNFSKFEKKIGVDFTNKNLLKQAFIHRSYLNENPFLKLEHNERLEFLGDAVLELATTEYLYKLDQKKTEGEMTSLRASLVNADMLSEIAKEIEIEDFLFLSRGEAKDKGMAPQTIKTEINESLIGALYLDKGYETIFYFLKKFLFPKLQTIIDKKLWIDAKSLFQEKAQDIVKITPVYKIIEEFGPDHAKSFKVGVYLNDELIAEGSGFSKQEAEQNSAHNALKIKNWKE